jgi:hypothetical protein
MDRWTGLAGPATLAGLLLSLATCASEEPAKTPAIINRCDVPAWVRYDDNPSAGTQTFNDKSATPIATQASYRADVSDGENDGVAIAVSATEAEVGTITRVPSVDPERLEVVLEGDPCPK